MLSNVPLSHTLEQVIARTRTALAITAVRAQVDPLMLRRSWCHNVEVIEFILGPAMGTCPHHITHSSRTHTVTGLHTFTAGDKDVGDLIRYTNQ